MILRHYHSSFQGIFFCNQIIISIKYCQRQGNNPAEIPGIASIWNTFCLDKKSKQTKKDSYKFVKELGLTHRFHSKSIKMGMGSGRSRPGRVSPPTCFFAWGQIWSLRPSDCLDFHGFRVLQNHNFSLGPTQKTGNENSVHFEFCFPVELKYFFWISQNPTSLYM